MKAIKKGNHCIVDIGGFKFNGIIEKVIGTDVFVIPYRCKNPVVVVCGNILETF